MADAPPIRFKGFKGLRNTVPPERLDPADLMVAVNVDLDQTGAPSRRRGRVKVLDLPCHSVWAQGSRCLLVAGTTLLGVEPGYTTTPLRADLTPNRRMSFCEVDERIYYSNGRETGIVEAGASRSWGLAVPAHVGAATAIAGALPAGQYQWTLTYLRDDGQESGAPLAGSVTLPADAGLALSGLPVSSDPAVAGKILYLSDPDGTVLYEAQVLPPEATTAQFLAPVSRSTPLPTPFLGPAPAGQLVAYYAGRLFVACGSILFYSEPLAYELFDLRHYVDLGGPINLLAPIDHGGLLVATDTQTGFLAGMDPESFEFVPARPIGAIRHTLAYAPGTLVGDGSLGERRVPLWMSTEGICTATPDGAIQNLTAARYRFTADPAVAGAGLFLPESARYLAYAGT